MSVGCDDLQGLVSERKGWLSPRQQEGFDLFQPVLVVACVHQLDSPPRLPDLCERTEGHNFRWGRQRRWRDAERAATDRRAEPISFRVRLGLGLDRSSNLPLQAESVMHPLPFETEVPRVGALRPRPVRTWAAFPNSGVSMSCHPTSFQVLSMTTGRSSWPQCQGGCGSVACINQSSTHSGLSRSSRRPPIRAARSRPARTSR
jgi:hypothetical protein